MTPSIFTCAVAPQIAELDIASGWGSPDSARTVLERHWDTFITASDFQYLASIGINTVRLPIGYWSLGPDFCQGTPFEPVAEVYQNSWSRVVRAINMAAESGIGVLVDLHGAPGSQNGQPHSGISDGQVNLFGNDWYENKTMAVLSFLAQELVNVTNIVGIQILNEPNNVDELPDFCTYPLLCVFPSLNMVFRCARYHDHEEHEPCSHGVSSVLTRRLRPDALQRLCGEPNGLRRSGSSLVLRLYCLGCIGVGFSSHPGRSRLHRKGPRCRVRPSAKEPRCR